MPRNRRPRPGKPAQTRRGSPLERLRTDFPYKAICAHPAAGLIRKMHERAHAIAGKRLYASTTMDAERGPLSLWMFAQPSDRDAFVKLHKPLDIGLVAA